MDKSNLIDSIKGQYLSLGKDIMSTIFPRDFEVYFCALELVDSEDNTIDYFSFPVMPKSIQINQNERTTVHHTLSGVVIMNSEGRTISDITLSGDFGRSFKITLANNISILSKGFRYSIENGVYSYDDISSKLNIKVKELIGVKTGYGCIKILQSIIDKAKGRDSSGKTFKLYLYNPAFGESYLVIPTKSPLSFSQNENASNMIWQYTLNLNIVGSLDKMKNIKKISSLSKSIAIPAIQKSISDVASSLTKYIK